MRRPFVVRTEELCVASDPEKEQIYRQKQSDEIIDLVLTRLDGMAARDPDGSPEMHATRLLTYQNGLLDGLVRTAPDLTEELAGRIERELCREEPEPSHVIALSHFINDMPELANQAAFDCVAARGKEDIALWSTLDAWRAAGMPPSPALSILQKNARDERTKSRLQGVDVLASALEEHPE
jgi:hypothetical protein